MSNTAPRIALVTGAGRRLGYELSRYLLQTGWQVMAHYRSATESVEHLRAAGATLLQADFEDEVAVLGLADQVKKAVPHLDLLVHNASCFSQDTADLQANLRAQEAFFRVHMMAPYALNLSLQPLLHASPRELTDIIHITDIYADRPNEIFAAYCSTKAGLANLSLSFAKRFAPKIKVNAIQPGPIKFLASHTDAVKQAVLKETLLGKEGGFEPVIQMIEAIVNNPFLTGASYKVDGGRSLM